MVSKLEVLSGDEYNMPVFESVDPDFDLGESVEIAARKNPALVELLASERLDPKTKKILYETLRKYSHGVAEHPQVRRAFLAHDMHQGLADLPEGVSPRAALSRGLYEKPGRHPQYPYVNSMMEGEETSKKSAKRRAADFLKYIIKEGWPVAVGGAGWLYGDRMYTKAVARGLSGRLKGSFDNKWWEYLLPGIGQARAAQDAAKFAAGEGILGIWGKIRMPLIYSLGAYAVYKTAKYFLKRRKEKKMEAERQERWERMRQDALIQNQMFMNSLQLQEAA